MSTTTDDHEQSRRTTVYTVSTPVRRLRRRG